MCGRFTLNAEESEIRQEYGLGQDISGYQTRYNIAPGQELLTIVEDGGKRKVCFLKWGLVPSWAKDIKIGYKMINARSETVHEKPSFKSLLARKRCLVIADSFYEWKKTGDEKQPKRISLKNRSLFSFAGLWDTWVHNDQKLSTCTILTKKANPFMQPIHHRMPVILPKSKEGEWVAAEERDPEEMHDFIRNLETDELTAYNVTDYVNSAKNEGEACIKPLV